MEELKRIVISCGGTGGHFNPGLSIAREFIKRGGEAHLMIGGKNADAQIEQARNYCIPCHRIVFDALPHNPLEALRFTGRSIQGYLQCGKLLKTIQPQALLAMGSFASLPPVLAAGRAKIPVFLHEGNARIGKSNRFLSRFATAMALSFPAVNEERARCRTVLTGLPLRQELLEQRKSKEDAIAELNLRYQAQFDPGKAVLLVFGGSLGAASLNKNVLPSEEDPATKHLQIIHLSGRGKLEDARKHYAKCSARTLLLETSPEMHLFYSAADFVICRSGGSTVSELAAFGKYAILVPYPYAAELHQDDNAQWLASANGAELIADNQCSPEHFGARISEILKTLDAYREKGRGSMDLAEPDAASNVLALMENLSFPLIHPKKK